MSGWMLLPCKRTGSVVVRPKMTTAEEMRSVEQGLESMSLAAEA